MRSRWRRRTDGTSLPMARPSRGVHDPPGRPHATRRPPIVVTAPPPPTHAVRVSVLALRPAWRPSSAAARGALGSIGPASAALRPRGHPRPPRPERLRARRSCPPSAGPERGFSSAEGEWLRSSPQAPPRRPSLRARASRSGQGPRPPPPSRPLHSPLSDKGALIRPGPRTPRLRACGLDITELCATWGEQVMGS